VLSGLPLVSDPNLIAGMERAEDAGVYKLTKELAVIQTLDFFTPIVDDPYDFGQVAVANALSDVYAKGGKPLTAMNIVCFPVKQMDITVLCQILRGGIDKMREAGVLLIGGHSVDDPELKYGLSVTGIIRPEKVVMNNGVKPGDKLILTKPLGTGIISTAIKAGAAKPRSIKKLTRLMTTLNKASSEAMMLVGVNACTDVTGFGFIGHACEMLTDTQCGMVIESSQIPFLPETKTFAEMGSIPGGMARNRDYRKHMVDMAPSVPGYLQSILYDPQTSGGLLIAVSKTKASRLVKALKDKGVQDVAIVGEVVAHPKNRIVVR
jgi:selenide,water dikinase